MVKITLNDRVVIVSGDKQDLDSIRKFETYKDTSRCFSKSGYDPRKEKNVPLMKMVQGSLVGFSGLVRDVIIYCSNHDIIIKEFSDKRTHFDFQDNQPSYNDYRAMFPKEYTYVDHQIKALRKMLETNKCIIKAATSAGKSTIMTMFVKITKLPTLILVNKVSLASQLRETFIKAGIDCGICSGKGVIKGDCMVSTIQSVKKITDLNRFSCLFVDECHEASSTQFQDFLKAFSPPLAYGFSATPIKEGNNKFLKFAQLRQFLGSIAVDIGATELMENAVMAKPHIYIARTECPETLEYPSAYDLGIVKNECRNRQVIEIAERYEKGVLILVNIIEHGETLLNKIDGSVFISGETSVEEREQVLKDFEEGKIRVLIGSGILQEGISITNVNALIYACSQKSVVAVLQKLGRALRFKKGVKTEVDFYDFLDNGNKYLLKHSLERISIYKKAGFTDIKFLS